MTTLRPSTFLRRVLAADVATCAAAGLLLTLGADALQGPLDLPAALMRYSGLGLLPFAAFLAYLATRETLPRAAVWSVVAGNALWAADSILLLLSGWVAPTAFGAAFVVAQAAGVAAFALLEYQGARGSAAADHGLSAR